MKFLIRQTYTTASLVAMVPAAIWSVVWYGTGNIISVISRFPFVYLVVCQVMIVSRYVGVAWLTEWFAHRYKQFDVTAGFYGFVGFGLLFDSWLTYRFATAVSQPPEGNMALLIPFFAIGYGLLLMLAASLIAGFSWPYVKTRVKVHVKRPR